MTIEMTSPRTAIRRRVCALLRAALPLWDARLTALHIHESRAVPLSPKKLPAVLIYTRDERLEDDAGHSDPGLRKRTLELAVEVVTVNPDADTQADTLVAAIETIVDNNDTLGELVEGTHLTRVSMDVDGDGDTVMVGARLEFEITYWTRPVYLAPLPPLPDDLEQGALGWAGMPPAYAPACDPPLLNPILGMTPELGQHPDDRLTIPLEVLASTAPFIGPEHKDCYEPATIPGQGFD